MWESGRNYWQISAEVGYSVWSVGQVVRSALTDARSKLAERHLDEHLSRLEELFRVTHTYVHSPDPDAATREVKTALAVLDRQARVLGLDGPKRSISIGVRATEALRQLLGALAAMPSPREALDAEDSEQAALPPKRESEIGSGQQRRFVPVGLGEANGLAGRPRIEGESAEMRRERERIERQVAGIWAV